MAEGSMNRFVLSLVLASAIAAPASANIITFAYNGKIVDGVDTSGLFGAPGADLTGDHILAVFVFDTALGLRGAFPGTTDSLIGGTAVPGSPPSPLVSATITINGESTTIGGDLLASALTNGGQFNASEAVQDNANFVSAFVYSMSAPASLDTPFTPQGSGGGSFNIDRVDALSGPREVATADFSIPEPATWAMMLMGLGGVGAAVRRVRRDQILAAI